MTGAMCGRFTKLVRIVNTGRKSGSRPIWRLTATLEYTDGAFSVIVPVGTETDFASAPRFFWRFAAPTDCPESSTLHDFLYRFGPGGKRTADWRFRRAMRSQGVPFLRRWAMWAAVAVFGFAAYRAARRFPSLAIRER